MHLSHDCDVEDRPRRKRKGGCPNQPEDPDPSSFFLLSLLDQLRRLLHRNDYLHLRGPHRRATESFVLGGRVPADNIRLEPVYSDLRIQLAMFNFNQALKVQRRAGNTTVNYDAEI